MNFLITDAIQMHRNSFDKSYIRKISKNHFTGLTHHSRLKKIGEEMVARWV